MVFVREYDGVDVTDLEVWRDDSLKYMRRHVKDLLQGADASWEVVIKNDAHYQHVLQVEVDGLEVDLLLAPDCAGGNAGRKWACMQHRRLTRPLLHAPAAASFDLVRHRADSAALNQFYIAASDEAKEVMRFVKGLYKSGIPSDQDHERIRSVSLEVLVLAAGQQLRSNRQCRKQRRGKVYKLQLFVEFLRLVVAAVKQRKVVMLDASYWCRAVRPYGYTREVGMQYDHIWGNDRVQIIHPTDFTCNLERAPEGRAPSDWSGLVRLAELLLCVLDSDSPSYFWLQPQVLHAMRAYGGDLKWMAWVEDVCLPTLRRLIRPKENKASRR
ncbi:hypothetical protein HXX76_010543 [Chlamydomonas incerta]|uniref:Uncharacterized protein n=1 Tax=Chlamydomonas incerta TaxID=51695 RepID=A0A835SMJ8_CHLIN|nr:hypothetical protein HXX76_010543 [Chlamydomonas incerta]|eukprot:KAG2429759.1 hypothetical protein HXX76_010543 [Chlamydomonas incerta]